MVSNTKNEKLKKKIHMIMKRFLLKNNKLLREEAEDLKFEKGFFRAPSRRTFKELKKQFSKNVEVKKTIRKKQGLVMFRFKHKLSGLGETYEVKLPKEMLPPKKAKKAPVKKKTKKKAPKKRNPVSKGFKKVEAPVKKPVNIKKIKKIKGEDLSSQVDKIKDLKKNLKKMKKDQDNY